MTRIFYAITAINLLLWILFVVNFFDRPMQQMAYVNSSKIINAYEGMKVARKNFEAKTLTWKTNIDSLAGELNKQIIEYERTNARMSVKERALSQELIKTKQEQLAQYQQAMQARAREEDTKMTKAILEQINSYIADYGKERGFAMILAVTEYGNIAYANEGLDLTEEVIEGLNKQFAGK